MFYLDSAVGVEIRGDSLVFAVVSRGLRGYELRGCEEIENWKDLSPPDLHARVRKFEETDGLDRENLILGLPRDQVVIRQMELPLEVEDSLDEVVPFQLDRFEPGEERQSYYDYGVLQRDVEAGKLLVQATMVPRDVVDGWLDLFRELNLYPAAIRTSSVGLFQTFSAHEDRFPQKEPYLVCAVDPDGMEFLFVVGSDQLFSEKILLNPEDLEPERIWVELDRFLSHLGGEWKRVARIYLSGLLAEDFLGVFRERYEDCELLSSKLNLTGDHWTAAAGNGWIGAIGLAISGISKSLPGKLNLIPAEKRVIDERPSLVSTLVLAGLLVIMGLVVATQEYFQQRQLLDQIDNQIQVLQPDVDRTMDLRGELEARHVELDALRGFLDGRQDVLIVLKELTEKIPDSSYLQNVNIQGSQVSLNGFSDSASTLLKILLESEYLEGIESRYITPDRNRQDGERFSFEARIKE